MEISNRKESMALHRKPKREVHPAVPTVVYFTVGALLLFGATFTVSDQIDDAVDPDNRNGVTAPAVPVDTDDRDAVDSESTVTADADDTVTATPEAVPPPSPRAQPTETTDAVVPPVTVPDTDADGVPQEQGTVPPVAANRDAVGLPPIVSNPPANVQPLPPVASQPLIPFVPQAPAPQPIPTVPAPLPTPAPVPLPSPVTPLKPPALAPILKPITDAVTPPILAPVVEPVLPTVDDAVEELTDPLLDAVEETLP